jgi:hypothetical protein
MSSPVAISQRRRPGAWLKPFARSELDHICTRPQFYADMARARLHVQWLPEQISARDMQETLKQLAVRLDAAARALRTLPLLAAVHLCATAKGKLPQPMSPSLVEHLATESEQVAAVARASAARIKKSPGRPVDHRKLHAVHIARELREKYKLRAGHMVECASLILGEALSADAFARLSAHLSRRRSAAPR